MTRITTVPGSSTVRPPGQRGVDREPAALPWSDLDVAAEDRDPLAHPDQTVAAVVGLPYGRVGGRTASVVDDLDVDTVLGVADADVGARRPGVLERVRQRFLDDAVDGQIDARWHAVRVTVDPQVDV